MSMWRDFCQNAQYWKLIFVVGRSDILFAGMYVCTFQPENFTGWGSERVNIVIKVWLFIEQNNNFNLVGLLDFYKF